MMMNITTLYAHIRATIAREAYPRKIHGSSQWHKNPDLRIYGLYAAELRDVIRGLKPRFGAISREQKLVLADRLYRAGIEELASVATYLVSLCSTELRPGDLRKFDRFTDHFHSWSTTDDFSLNVAGPLLQRYPGEIIRLLRKWNKSSNPWKRRASVVTFTRKVGKSDRFTAEALRLCDNLIWDSEDLVQKGVGWALKDTLRGDKQRVLRYIKHLRSVGAPATITLYAMRDLSGNDRRVLLGIGRRAIG